ncbi:MAG TPA: RNase adapter RapZ, partial [Gammaproteobacteria bacterium]|nr:RNase adapter RapZ [Gammaproteobacteria bacterium]
MGANQKQPIQLVLKSFGFKYGLPPEVDFVFDVRCLPNPHWEPDLKELSGLDTPVIQYLERIPAAQSLLKDISTFL